MPKSESAPSECVGDECMLFVHCMAPCMPCSRRLTYASSTSEILATSLAIMCLQHYRMNDPLSICSFLVQYTTLTKRALRTTLRNPSESAVRLLVGCYIGMFAGNFASEAINSILRVR